MQSVSVKIRRQEPKKTVPWGPFILRELYIEANFKTILKVLRLILSYVPEVKIICPDILNRLNKRNLFIDRDSAIKKYLFLFPFFTLPWVAWLGREWAFSAPEFLPS